MSPTETLAGTPVMAGLRATKPSGLPFSNTFEVRAYVLERDEGDVVVYGAPGAAGIRGPVLQLLGHWHEAAFGGAPADAPLLTHEAETPWIPESWPVSRTIDRRALLGDDLWAIPIPGHTAGSVAYLWDSGRQRFLFTADSVYLRGDAWVAAVLDSSDREAYVESLGVLRDLDFDVLVPWGVARGSAPVAAVTRDEARRRLDAVRARVAAGEDR